MPFFDRIKSGADKAAFEANRMMRVNQVQNEINGLKGQLAGRRDELGAAVYEQFKAGQLTDPKLVAICEAMRTLEAQVSAKEKDVEKIRQEQAPGTASQPAKPAAPAAPAPMPTVPQAPASTIPTQVTSTPASSTPAAGAVYGHICPNEQIQLPANVMFCPSCGAKAIDVPPPAQAPETTPAPNAAPSVCPNCQTPLAPNAVFCPNCGTRVAPV